MMSSGAARALGFKSPPSAQVTLDTLVPADAREESRALIDRALSGMLPKVELRMLTAQGTALARFSSSAVGKDDARGVLLSLEHLAPLVEARPTSDYDYEVAGVTRQEYRLQRVWQPSVGGTPANGKCFEVLHGLRKPCDKCPLSRGETARPQVSASRQAPYDYVVTSFTLQDDDCARVSVRRVSAASFSAVMQARLDELAERAQLSKRERSVFVQLMEGRAVDEIASELSISPRTVKFHQANVLQKLGADSRTDLIRLVF